MLTIPLDSHLPLALYQQIYRHIKNEITKGALPCHEKLPSTRSLAMHLNISRNTVDMAYGQLLSEGYIEAVPKKGYFVSEIDALAHIAKEPFSPMAKASAENDFYEYDFSPFSIDLSHFPYHTWTQLSKKCLQDNTDLFLLGENQGDAPFRDAIASYLRSSRGVNCSASQIVVGAGADYLLQLLVSILKKSLWEKHFLNPSLPIAMENPSYRQACSIFDSLGCQVLPVGLDQHGLNIHALSDTLCNVVYVTPSHQYPMGIVMPIKRRAALLNWAYSKENRYIIEDDHDSEFRYKGKPIPSLQSIDYKERVIYIGTFSRAIAPSIRIGYMVLPSKLLEQYRQFFSFYACTVSRIDQAILTEFISKGYFERHLNRMRKVYKTRHDALLSQLKAISSKQLPHLEIFGENAGMHLVIRPHNGSTEKQLIEQAREKKIKVYGLSSHFIAPPKPYEPSLLIGYANLAEEEIQTGIEKLFF